MPTNFSFGIDWQRKGVICWDARPGDALNKLPRPITYSRLDFRTSSVVSSAALARLNTLYGTWTFTVQTGAGSNNGFVLGQDNVSVADDIPASPSAPYGVALWLRGMTGFTGIPFILRVKNQAGTVLFTSSAFNLTAAWQRVSVTGNTNAATTHLIIEVIKNGNIADVGFQAAGVMLIEGATVPAGYNAGYTSDLYDNVTDRVESADWFIGIHKAYQTDADDSILKLRLTNQDRRYSPENMGSPLAGLVNMYRPVQIRSDDGSVVRTHFTGWLESIRPTPNQYGKRLIDLKASGPMLFFEDVQTSIGLQENKRTDEIVNTLLNEVQIPPPLTGVFVLDATGYGELGTTSYLADTVISNSLQTGLTTLAYAGDTWVKPAGPEDEEPASFNTYRAIKDTVAAERGRFFFDRDGKAIFWNRHRTLLAATTTPVATFNNTMAEIAYEYAGLGQFKNEVIVSCNPRTISPDDNELLWKLDKPITIQPGKSQKITANYADQSKNRIGGKNVRLENLTFSKGNAGRTIKIGGNRAILEFTNTSRTQVAEIATAELRGKKITSEGKLDVEARDGLSMVKYGQRTMTLNIAALDDVDNAQTIADFELGRRKDPRGTTESMILRSHVKDGGNQHDQQLARSIGDLIQVQEAQTTHDSRYFIIGEAHKISDGELYETTWYLEPATSGNYWVLPEVSDLVGTFTRLGVTTNLAY